jgi:hypothetical protein
MKEFDAPDVANFIDPDTIDKIHASHKPPLHMKKKPGEKDAKQVRAEHEARINKMKDLYGMFMKMEKEENSQDDGEPTLYQ